MFSFEFHKEMDDVSKLDLLETKLALAKANVARNLAISEAILARLDAAEIRYRQIQTTLDGIDRDLEEIGLRSS